MCTNFRSIKTILHGQFWIPVNEFPFSVFSSITTYMQKGGLISTHCVSLILPQFVELRVLLRNVKMSTLVQSLLEKDITCFKLTNQRDVSVTTC